MPSAYFVIAQDIQTNKINIYYCLHTDIDPQQALPIFMSYAAA